MAINSVTDLRNTDATQTAFTVRQNPSGGSTACHAVQITQSATAGDGAGINVVSNNSSAPAIRTRAAGPLIQLYNASNELKFDIANTGTMTMQDDLVVKAVTSATDAASLPYGTGASTAATGLTISSSYPSDDISGGTDGTGRISLYSYQRANTNSFGETIRNFAMRSDAKSMTAWYIPVTTATGKSAYNTSTREALTSGVSWKPVAWTGAHFEANDHGSVHGHWEMEIPDSSGALQGRLEIPFIDQATDADNALNDVTIGVDYTNIRTNLSDFSVRAQNITSGPYNGQNTVLRIGGANAVHKELHLSIGSDMGTSGRRWSFRANNTTESSTATGTDLQILRFDNTGTLITTALGIERSSGNTTIGASPGGRSSRVAAVWSTSGDHGFSAQPSSTPGTGAGFDAQMAATTDRAFQSTVSGDANRRFVVLTDGQHEWGDGTSGRDVNLYRGGADQLKTDDSLIVSARATVGTTSLQNAQLYSTSDGTRAAAQFVASADGTASLGTVIINPSSTSKRGLDIRLAADSVSRLRVDMSAGTGAGTIVFGNGTAADTNLYRSAADTLTTDDALTVGAGLTVTGNSTVTGDLTLQGSGKAYRFRRSGSALDLDATGVDLLISNFSGTAFDGTQRSYFRLSADAQNVQVAGKVEFADALYGTVRHTLNGAANSIGFFGTAATTKQTVTGAKGSNAALASLLTALAAYGLITDSTSA